MVDLPIAVRVGLFFGVFAVIGLIWTQAQRLGDVRSKPASRALGVMALIGSVAWIEFGLWIFLKINLVQDLPKTFWGSVVLVVVGVATWAIVKGWFKTHPVDTQRGLSVLFVKMWEESPMREDLIGQHLFELSLRSDYDKPTGLEFLRWEESGAKVKVLPVTHFMRFVGLRYPKGRPPYSSDEILGAGPSKMVVNPGEAIRLTIRLFHTVMAWPETQDVIPDDHPIGIVVLRVEGKEVHFDIRYKDVRKQELSRRYRLPVSLPDTRLRLQSGSNLQLMRTENELISTIGFTVSNSRIDRRNTVSNVRATFTFSNLDEKEPFTVAGLFGPANIDGSPLILEKSVSLVQGDVRHLPLIVSRSALPMMAADRTKYFTLSDWPLDENREKHVYEVKWLVTVKLSTDSIEDDISRTFSLQIFPPPQSGVSIGTYAAIAAERTTAKKTIS